LDTAYDVVDDEGLAALSTDMRLSLILTAAALAAAALALVIVLVVFMRKRRGVEEDEAEVTGEES
jgi:hypothetical protein